VIQHAVQNPRIQNVVQENANQNSNGNGNLVAARAEGILPPWKQARKIYYWDRTEFLENKPIVAGVGPEWLFDIDMLTKLMNYVPVIAGTNSTDFAGTKDSFDAGQSSMETGSTQNYIFMPLWKYGSPLFDSSPKISDDAGSPLSSDAGMKHVEVSDKESEASNELNSAFKNLNTEYPDGPKMPGLETIATYDDSKEEADFTNLESLIYVSHTLTTITHKNHPLKQVMHEELLQFKLQKVWILVDLPKGKKAIGIKWVLRNKKDERVIMIKSKERLFLAYASFMGFMVYQMDVKSDFLYGRIIEEKKDAIFISQNKYLTKVLRKFNFLDVKSASTLVDIEKTLVKDADGDDVDVYLYRSMIGSLMYLTASRPYIMYAFLGSRLISWQCKKQTVVVISTNKAEYVVAASCCGQVFWIQNQMMDYGYNFMHYDLY
nr:ribonuclease H-like domain-containing protein [Tanacetum cinerariifolium]